MWYLKMIFHYYLQVRVVSANRYLPRGSNKNTLYITSTGNVSIARWVIPLVTIPLLDLVTIRWIQGKSLRKTQVSFSTVHIHDEAFCHWLKCYYACTGCMSKRTQKQQTLLSFPYIELDLVKLEDNLKKNSLLSFEPPTYQTYHQPSIITITPERQLWERNALGFSHALELFLLGNSAAGVGWVGWSAVVDLGGCNQCVPPTA